MPRIISALSSPMRFWVLTLAALLALLATLSLGRWQLERAAQKQALFDAVETRRTLPVLTGSDWLSQPPAQLLHRPVLLRGRFLPEHTVFLDNRQMHGRPGFFVLTPFQLEGIDAAVVVQRGWTPRNFLDREALPDIATPTGQVQLGGRIAAAPAKLFEFADAGRGRIRQNLDLHDYALETRLKLAPISVLQQQPEQPEQAVAAASAAVPSQPPAAPDQLLRDWPVASSGVDKHYGYAFQWFGLGALIAFLYVWYQFIAPRRRRRPTD